MTTAEWLEKNLAAAPPLSAAQVAVLRPVFAAVIPHMRTPPAETRGAPAIPAQQEPGRKDPCNA